MLKHPEITLKRVERFLKNELLPLVWRGRAEMVADVFQSSTPLRATDAARRIFAPVQPGFAWGPIYTDAWFRLRGEVPADWSGEIFARLDLGAEAIVWECEDPLQGIDPNHDPFRISAQPGEPVELLVQATGMNPNVSFDARPLDPGPTPFTYRHAYLAVRDAELWQLYLDMHIAVGVLKEQPENEPRRGQLLYALNAAVNAFDAVDRATIAECRRIVAETYQRPATASAHRMSGIGHAHIDTAWLWPLERTQRKCIHTFATATRLMEEYPEYKFICSQAQQYAWVKELAPALYERMKEKARAGQWEVAGSMWVEADCNVPSGESLVRQILYGKRFWMEEFGIETVDLWLPDVFGYSAALPQILKKSGINYFLTQKISWNQTNKFPHHTFLWQGIDGTQIFSHFPPADTYTAAFTPKELAYAVHNFRDHDRATRSLFVYGYGDGGGGPTAEMIETARRVAATEGMPRVELEFARDFFAKAEADARDLPVWVGELYLELHRGTYTTQARNKRANRKCEFLLRDAEFLACFDPRGLSHYPAAELDRAWKLLLLNQFHDIIPGSSVHEVYIDSDRDYAEIEQTCERIVADSLSSIASNIDTTGLENPVLVLSTVSNRRNDVVEIALEDGFRPQSVFYGPTQYGDDAMGPVQLIDDGRAGLVGLWSMTWSAAQYGYSTYDLREAEWESRSSYEPLNPFTVSTRVLDNGPLRIEFDQNGLIARIVSGSREIVPPGLFANELQLFDDRPLFWDAWDIDPYYQEKGRGIRELESVEVLECGPVRGAIRFTRSFGASRIVQTVRLARQSNRIDFVTEIDWHEEHKLLKVAFPVDVNASRAIYEIQYGHVERPTHYNTSWDAARFEVAAQKWAYLCEGDFGVALLNNGKYGYDIHGNTLRLTLLRAPQAPDPLADMGSHSFTYALLLAEDVEAVIDQAYALNAPPRAIRMAGNRPGPMEKLASVLMLDRSNVVIEAVKRAEDEDAIVVRLYEAENCRGIVQFETSLPVTRAHLCDLLERDEDELPVECRTGGGARIRLIIKPFEIVTLKLRL